VFDPYGEPIPDAEISLKQNGKIFSSVKTDRSGRFSIQSSPGAYDLYMNARNFVPGDVRIEVGSDLIGAFRSSNLWVILQVAVLSEDYGPFVTKSRRHFENAIQKHDPRLTDHD
jgi:hypothetical protein